LILLGILITPGLLAARVLRSGVRVIVGPVAVVALMLGIAALPIKRKVTPQEFADELERHLNGTDSDDDWDRTSCVRISDLRLEGVRQSLSDGFDSLSSPQDREELRRIIDALRRGGFPGARAGSDT
jgi:hypothetical protein